MPQADSSIAGQTTIARTGFKLFGTTIPLGIVKKEADEEIIKPSSSSSPTTSTTTTSSGEEGSKVSDEKTIACPRCKSMETKFCYFNNYNVNQPRHFCKACQRYWTAGGTLRNVPVGAGRRKAKPPGFSSTGVGELGIIHGMVQQWEMATVGSSFQHGFPGKRRHTNPTGQIC